MANKQIDQKNQKQTPPAQSGKAGQQEGKPATMPLKPSAQPQGTRPGQHNGGEKDRQAGQNTAGTTNDNASQRDKSAAGSKSPGRDDNARDHKSNQNTGAAQGNKKARVEGGPDEDRDRDETGKPTGMEDTRITSSIDDEDMDGKGKSTDEVARSDRNKNANGGSNKPR